MPRTSLSGVSNSSSKSFTNAKGAISNVNYGRIVGSYDNVDIAYNIKQNNSIPTRTFNLPITNNTSNQSIHMKN